MSENGGLGAGEAPRIDTEISATERTARRGRATNSEPLCRKAVVAWETKREQMGGISLGITLAKTSDEKTDSTKQCF